MAGIEQLEIHSKSYIVRWVKVADDHTISWSVQPHKNSINFGIVKHPGSGATNLAAHTDDASIDQLNKSTDNVKAGSRFSKNDASTARDQLASKGFTNVKWHGKCEADKVSMGTFDVNKSQGGGMYGLVFDNTFSKQKSKTATFVVLTYPTDSPPQGTHHLPNHQAGPQASTSSTSLGKSKNSPHLGPGAAVSTESLQSSNRDPSLLMAPRSNTGNSMPVLYHTGNLLKRRRKKRQGYANRFFSLDYTTCTLAYYYNRKSSALRGAIPLSLAAIAADERRREISIDSGAEIWHLKASNADDFREWARALERASRSARGLEAAPQPRSSTKAQAPSSPRPPNTHQEEDREWEQVEALLSRVVGTRDALRRLVKDMGTQKQFQRPTSSYLSPTPGLSEESDSYFTPPTAQEKKSFWKRRQSTATTTAAALAPAVTSSLAVPTPGSANTLTPNGSHAKTSAHEEKSTQEHCAALLNDLDRVVSDFTNVISNSKRRRVPLARAATARRSMESSTTADEFFDAEGGDSSSINGGVMVMNRPSAEDSDDGDSDADEASIHDSSSISSVEEEEEQNGAGGGAAALFPVKPKSLNPLPIDIAADRRQAVPPNPTVPPSIMALVRKYVGQDMSQISMPVTTNEPLSLAQRVSEQLEYAQLLDAASQLPSATERFRYVTAFAISQISVNRVKERAIRKPFNPLLGETFELLRTETETPGGFRLLVEKVCHRPVRLAMHADSANWSFAQTASPSQKFYGKSAELTTEGRVRVALRLPDGTDELYSWNHGTMYLRNMVIGEKYIEPSGNMTVYDDSNGNRAVVEFCAPKGMFGGRCEEVEVKMYGPDGRDMSSGLQGSWTSALRAKDGGKVSKQDLWKVGSIVPDPKNMYGMTTFAAGLNQETVVEKGRLPPTDSRLRPDQRMLEDVGAEGPAKIEQRLDVAEQKKQELENAQRQRRSAREQSGEPYKPLWFVKVDDEAGGQGGGEDGVGNGGEIWKMKGGKDGYWERRGKGDWKGCEDIFLLGGGGGGGE